MSKMGEWGPVWAPQKGPDQNPDPSEWDDAVVVPEEPDFGDDDGSLDL